MSQRLRALMLGIASALKNGPAATSSVWDSGRLKNISFSHRQPCARIAKRHDDRHRALARTMLQDSIKQLIGFRRFGGVSTNKLQHGKVYGWVLLPTIIQCSFDRTQNGPASASGSPFGRQRPADRLVGNAVRAKCAFALRIPSPCNRE
jgi:hypothetical protein